MILPSGKLLYFTPQQMPSKPHIPSHSPTYCHCLSYPSCHWGMLNTEVGERGSWIYGYLVPGPRWSRVRLWLNCRLGGKSMFARFINGWNILRCSSRLPGPEGKVKQQDLDEQSGWTQCPSLSLKGISCLWKISSQGWKSKTGEKQMELQVVHSKAKLGHLRFMMRLKSKVTKFGLWGAVNDDDLMGEKLGSIPIKVTI